MPRLKKSDWIGTKEASLALEISSDKLVEWINEGVFKSGKHYRDISFGKKRPTYRFNLTAIEKLFEA